MVTNEMFLLQNWMEAPSCLAGRLSNLHTDPSSLPPDTKPAGTVTPNPTTWGKPCKGLSRHPAAASSSGPRWVWPLAPPPLLPLPSFTNKSPKNHYNEKSGSSLPQH